MFFDFSNNFTLKYIDYSCTMSKTCVRGFVVLCWVKKLQFSFYTLKYYYKL